MPTMGKRAKQSDPLRPRASRVEKARKSRAELPSWYHRVVCLRWDQSSFGYTNPRDFDEDLSELSSEEESEEDSEEESEEEDDSDELEEEEEDCECGGEDVECVCQFSDEYDSEDDESERSYHGSDADWYYEMKEEREERKREKLEERLELYKYRQLKFVRSKEEEVRAACESTRKAQAEERRIPVTSLADQEFELFCSDYVDHFCKNGRVVTGWVEFIHPDDMDRDSDEPDKKSDDDAGLMYGMLCLDGNASCSFGPFFPPTLATRRPVRVESCDGKYTLRFDFLCDDYLKLRVSRKFVFMNTSASPANPPPLGPAPEVFEFLGIWVDPEREDEDEEDGDESEDGDEDEDEEREQMEILKERMRMERGIRPRRSPSPRESWFELSHPMGAWRSGW